MMRMRPWCILPMPLNVQDVWINGERVVDNKKLVNVSLEALKRELKVEMTTFEERAVELSNQLSFK